MNKRKTSVAGDPRQPTSGRGDVAGPARRYLALALDVGDGDTARSLARRLRPWFGVVKVGLELFSAAGSSVVPALVDDGFDVFLDVKLHDIPTTVGRAASVLGRLGASYVTVHLSGGEAMVRAAVEGLAAGAGAEATPMVLGVTVLTSDAQADPERVARRVGTAVAAGCGGVVCSGSDLHVVRRTGPGLLAVVPGIRLAGAPTDDQARVTTPAQALAAGAGMLVVGRTVTAAADPEAAAAAVHHDLAGPDAEPSPATAAVDPSRVV